MSLPSQNRNWPVPIEGGCACGALRYRLDRTPIVVHCCHCHACQRETGSAFAVNAVVETEAVTLLPGTASSPAPGVVAKPTTAVIPTASGGGQLTVHCPHCFTAVWSHYPRGGPYLRMIKTGTLDETGAGGASLTEALVPDFFIYSKFQQSWVVHPRHAQEEGRLHEERYDRNALWPEESLARWRAVLPKVEANWRQSSWEAVQAADASCLVADFERISAQNPKSH